jgi:hypothetical protein
MPHRNVRVKHRTVRLMHTSPMVENKNPGDGRGEIIAGDESLMI